MKTFDEAVLHLVKIAYEAFKSNTLDYGFNDRMKTVAFIYDKEYDVVYQSVHDKFTTYKE